MRIYLETEGRTHSFFTVEPPPGENAPYPSSSSMPVVPATSFPSSMPYENPFNSSDEELIVASESEEESDAPTIVFNSPDEFSECVTPPLPPSPVPLRLRDHNRRSRRRTVPNGEWLSRSRRTRRRTEPARAAARAIVAAAAAPPPPPPPPPAPLPVAPVAPAEAFADVEYVGTHDCLCCYDIFERHQMHQCVFCVWRMCDGCHGRHYRFHWARCPHCGR